MNLAANNYANIFTVHIGKDGAKSHLTFGGFNPAYMAAPNTPPNYFKIDSTKETWRIETTGLMFGSTVAIKQTVTDTDVLINSNYIVLPKDSFEEVKATIEKLHKPNVMKVSTNPAHFYFEGACPTAIPDLNFTFKQTANSGVPTIYSVPASSWLKNNNGNCDILLEKGLTLFSLGKPFLENFYSGFDI